jgi:adenylate kinase
MDRGDLVSDDVILGIVSHRMDQPDVAKGVVFDGFPRTPAQAKALDKMLASRGQKLHAVIEMKADDDELVARISGRFTCKTCGLGYHDTYAPTKIAGTCDSCGGHDFVRRPDDNEKTVRDRLTVYNKQTAPLVDYYRETGTLHVVDGMAEINAVTASIGAVLDKLA